MPTGNVAVANGVPTGRREHGGRTTWSYLQRQPMATELIQLAVAATTCCGRAAIAACRSAM